MSTRRVDLAVLSDLHLGTRHCRADELIGYLDALDPDCLVLNGDIVDLVRMRRHWPASHIEVVTRFLKFAKQGVKVHLLAGNHDGSMLRLAPFLFGHIAMHESLTLDLAGERVLFLHGDLAELLEPPHRLLHWAGGHAYDGMMCLGHGLNSVRHWLGRPPVSIMRTLKERLPCAQQHIARYEESCATIAAKANCDTVVCGHIHLPRQRTIRVSGRSITYRNSGDWVENCSALELADGFWRLVDADGDAWIDNLAQRPTMMPAGMESVIAEVA